MSKKQRNATTAQPVNGLSRRGVLGISAGAAAATLIPGVATSAAVPDWQPKFFDPEHGQMLATLSDLILPKTDTPSATEAGVHEYIDEALSVADGDEQLEFLGGLAWIAHRAKARFGGTFASLTAKQQSDLLREIADDREHSSDLAAGATFFRDLKRRTLFGYYTSKRGRTEALGRPEAVKREKLEGCTHGADGHG